MSDRILDIQLEPNVFFQSDASANDFWEQYFELQKLTEAADMADGRFSLHLVNKATGEELTFSSVRLSAESSSISH